MNPIVDATGSGPPTRGRAPMEAPTRAGLFPALSRELCRPLISIRAGFDLLLAGCEGPVTPAQHEQLQGLRRQCDALIGLTRSFLDFAGSEGVDRPLDAAPFRLGSLIAEAERQFACRVKSRDVAWSCALSGPDGTVTTDLACLQKVLCRLVSNALAQTGEGGRIAVSGRVEAEAWSIAVLDDGPGIPPESIGRVFEPLTRLGGSTSAPAADDSGHGMGLAVCQAIVGRLGGTITIRSDPGRGTEVSVRFPM